ncbi:MAG: hypothetical protein ACREBI_00680 [Nitrosotalea sp.]
MAVFVSHSKNDQNLVKYFSQIFAHIGLKAKFMEWEDLDNKYAGKEIADMIRDNSLFGENISATIVLLGHGLQSSSPTTIYPQYTIYPQSTPTPLPYTHNWVNFEVGVSVGSRKPVWIFEDFKQFIQFPIPYVTDYCQYTLDDTENLKQIGNILTQRIIRNQNLIPPRKVKCPNEKCHAEYNYWSNEKSINCPVCRKGLTFLD